MSEPVVETFDMNLSIEKLMGINRKRTWALSREEIEAIRSYFRRAGVKRERAAVNLGMPTDVELEAIARTWSEHCKSKIFNAVIDYEEDGRTKTLTSLFTTFVIGSTERIRRGKGRHDFCVSAFKDNTGVVRFSRKYDLAFKVETHTTPSALDPCGGALTGIVGANRHPFGIGMGAKLIFNTDVFCFALPDYNGPVYPRLLHPRRVMEGVREGVEQGGNKSGIPTVNGSLLFDQGFLGKPLVFCGTCGIMPRMLHGAPPHLKRARRGDLIVMVADPITQKQVTDFLLIARDHGLCTAVTDTGAGGLSSSVGEMARDTNGCILHIDRAPLKYPGLSPWEILLSEAQEQMTVAVSPEKVEEFLRLSKEMNVRSTVLGEFTDRGKFHVLYRDRTVAYLDMAFLHDGLPDMRLSARWERKINDEPPLQEPEHYLEAFCTVLGRWNVCSKEYVVRRYDYDVQEGSAVKPLVGRNNDGPSDGSVLRPDLAGMEGVVVSHGICPKFSRFDTYHMVACAIDEAIRNSIATGGSLSHMALLVNLCWSDPVLSEKNPEGPYRLAQLVRANMALYDYTTLFGTPCISGNNSTKNDCIFQDMKISVPQTVLLSALSVVPDVRRAVTMDFKAGNHLIAVVGRTYPELGGSEYFSSRERHGNIAPRVRGTMAKKTFQRMERAIASGLVRSCHDLSNGGLAVALAESAFAGNHGAEIDLRKVPSTGIFRDDFLLFSESQSRFIISIRKRDLKKVTAIFKGIPWGVIGTVREDTRLLIRSRLGHDLIDTDIAVLKKAWQAPFQRLFGG